MWGFREGPGLGGPTIHPPVFFSFFFSLRTRCRAANRPSPKFTTWAESRAKARAATSFLLSRVFTALKRSTLRMELKLS